MPQGLGPNAGLIGEPGSRARLATPCLTLDLDAFEANLAAMAAWAKGVGIGLRPHGKAHKCPEIARRQIAAGALGVCAATLGEAEAFVEGGVENVLVTSPLVAPGKAARAAALRKRAAGLMVTAEHSDAVDALAAAARAAGVALDVVVEIDVGTARTGVATPADALALAQRIAANPPLRFAGVQGYAGHLQHIYAYADRLERHRATMAPLAEAVRLLREAGLPPGIVTGGGTGSHRLEPKLGLLTELQVGSYVFMDVDYAAVDLTGPESNAQPFRPALFVQASVVSVNRPGVAIIDAGLKAFATDGPKPAVHDGAPAGTLYRYKGDEHGALDLPPGAAPLPLGATVTLVAPHCDPTVNLYDAYHVVRGDTLVDIWPVAGRGRL